MSDDLEARLRAVEDRLAVVDLIQSYGPLIDAGDAAGAAGLWMDGGGYDFTGTRLRAPDEIRAVYESTSWAELSRGGSAHLTSAPVVAIDGDRAEALCYTFVVLPEEDRYVISRAAVNRWSLVRDGDGWRVAERVNRGIDGSEISRGLLAQVTALDGLASAE